MQIGEELNRDFVGFAVKNLEPGTHVTRIEMQDAYGSYRGLIMRVFVSGFVRVLILDSE